MMRRLITILALLALATPCAGAPTKVQVANTSSASGTGAMTLGGAPTPGNLLIAELGSSVDAYTVLDTAKWTLITNGGTSNGQIFAAYRYVQGGDTVTVPPLLTGVKAKISAWVIEVSGVTGTWASDFEGSSATFNNASTTLTTTHLATRAANDLALTGAFNYTSGATNITGASGWTFDVQQNNNANYGAWALAERTFVSSGTDFSTSYTIPTGAQPSGYITVVLSGAGTGAGTAENSSKTNDYVVLNAGHAGAISASKASAYAVLNVGHTGQSVSKANAYVVLQALHGNSVIFHSFPP